MSTLLFKERRYVHIFYPVKSGEDLVAFIYGAGIVRSSV